MNHHKTIHNHLINYFYKGSNNDALCISMYLFLYSRKYSDEAIQRKAEDLVDKIYNSLSTQISSYNLDELISITNGFVFLEKNAFLEFTQNDTFSDINNHIFRQICHNHRFSVEKNISSYIHILKHLLSSINKDDSSTSQKHIKTRLISLIINELYKNITQLIQLVVDPYLFDFKWMLIELIDIFNDLIEYSIYEDKVKQIIDEFIPRITTFIPSNYYNKYKYAVALKKLHKNYPCPELSRHYDLLVFCLNNANLANNDFNDKSINIRNGLSGAYLLLGGTSLNESTDSEKKLKIILKKIEESSYWDNLKTSEINYSILDGITGIGILSLIKDDKYITTNFLEFLNI